MSRPIFTFAGLSNCFKNCKTASDKVEAIALYGKLRKSVEHKIIPAYWGEDDQHQFTVELFLDVGPSWMDVLYLGGTSCGTSETETHERCCASLIERVWTMTRADECGLAWDVGSSSRRLSSTSTDEGSMPALPIKPYVFIAIDLEATTEPWENYRSGTKYPQGTPTQIGISILRATGESADLFAKDPRSSVGTEFRHIQVKEFTRYRTRVGKLKHKDAGFLYGKTDFIALEKVNEQILKLIANESKHGEVILVGHAIQNDQKFLEQANIRAFHDFFPGALDTQALHLDAAHRKCRSLQNLVWSYDETLGAGWHNAGNDAMWTLWIFAKKLRHMLMVSDSGEEMVLDYSRFPTKVLSKLERWNIIHAAQLVQLQAQEWHY
ncbi:hypothetical protein DSL72_008685 [Monilinia vaccinii-corymbosi]|uniref:Exonuclease domain-containing protein n=1 Tax=Monilinia vaccinii-corymbosi TaxID=61207 RepID=A0A8A3PPZ3_9HELO|nr:hypothetical protein DSL72_008685 [Monilinia vaccinii-corymbosi]